MNKKITLIFLSINIITAVLLLAFYAGILSQQSTLSTETMQALSSKVIPSIVANGEVTSISGRTLTLTREGESIQVPVAESAEISLFSAYNTMMGGKIITPVKSKINFEDIKIGQTASVIMRVSPKGELKGISVSVFPQKGGSQ